MQSNNIKIIDVNKTIYRYEKYKVERTKPSRCYGLVTPSSECP